MRYEHVIEDCVSCSCSLTMIPSIVDDSIQLKKTRQSSITFSFHSNDVILFYLATLTTLAIIYIYLTSFSTHSVYSNTDRPKINVAKFKQT